MFEWYFLLFLFHGLSSLGYTFHWFSSAFITLSLARAFLLFSSSSVAISATADCFRLLCFSPPCGDVVFCFADAASPGFRAVSAAAGCIDGQPAESAGARWLASRRPASRHFSFSPYSVYWCQARRAITETCRNYWLSVASHWMTSAGTASLRSFHRDFQNSQSTGEKLLLSALFLSEGNITSQPRLSHVLVAII